MSYQNLCDLLDALGTTKTRHSGRNLKTHLIGTYKLLKAAGCDEQVCLAGGLHSIYGTDVFRTRTLPLSARPDVARLFGAEAEGLAYLFGMLEPRTKMLERMTIAGSGSGVGHALRLIEAANILEQGGTLDKWPNIRAAWEAQTASGCV